MKQSFMQCLVGAMLISLAALPVRAQYVFKDSPDASSNGLGPYSQNFDALAGTKATFGSNTTLPGVYAKYVLDTGTFAGVELESYTRAGTSAKLGPDDGTEGATAAGTVDADGTPHGPSWYHFGAPGGTDRALGGIAGTTTGSGKGYVGIRLKNSSTKTIVNLEIQYAMEQWYNSSQTQAANVTVDYQRTTTTTATITSLTSGTWLPIADLGVPAPSTSTAIAPRNGNAATNRRVKQTTLVGINLLAGQEIMVRFGYVFNSSTNGNGLSVDDIVITPQTNIFYSLPGDNKNLDSKNNWGTNVNGTGTAPTNFTADNTIYYVQGSTGSADRINGTWTVSGANSKIVVGTPSSPASLYVNANDLIQGTVDVGAGSTLQINQVNNNLSLGALHPSSTVEYVNGGTTNQNVKGASYGTLKLSGTGPKLLTGNVLVNAGLAFNTTGASILSLADYNLLLLKGATLTGLNGANTFFVTNGKGSLQRTVSSDGVEVLFPVGTSATSYTPALLSQTQAQSEDTYSVRVAPEAYVRYINEVGVVGTEARDRNVKKTWFVGEEVSGNSNLTLKLQWNDVDVVTGFQNSLAHINHYLNGAWDRYTAQQGASAGTVANSSVVSRTGITSFSPFAVSSLPNGSLPVVLTAFGAQRAGTAVACTWTTATEHNSRDFTVERSRNGLTFELLGRVAAQGSSSGPRAYRFADEHPLAGLAYYRLRQTDLDGTESFSQVVAVNGSAAVGMPAVVPNPGTGRFALVDADGQPLAGPAVVINTLGAVVRRVPASQAGASSFDLSDQPAGLYLVQVPTAAGTYTVRVVKN
ncbi:T9SS type A sorting domain-containing protein [Hymenobacter armeniacus]|uniref:T9SS type A sorting domain-containing protein n=1 Tax=Hymenobacter armeniacus TaxID=2771358 RepID=A0ABR8JPN8_9BACT|nr:T9SS type A sorting domain-containing protein [Hymenobacter armeniacus]MBD2721957.1 T9SS type A sorting domain-containing protein [Hymenobacter armeniacus]